MANVHAFHRVSALAMVGWIILAHNLWEKSNDDKADYLRRLYNTATILTLFITVCLFYFLLFLLFSIAILIIIPMGMLQSQLSGEVGYMNYFYIAWTANKRLDHYWGAGICLENEEVVLSSTYGYRQRQRYKQLKESKQGKKEDEEEKKEAAQEKKQAEEIS